VTADANDDPGVKIELRDLSVIIPRTMLAGPAGYRLTTCHLGCPWDAGTPDCVTSPWFPFLVGDDASSGALIERPTGRADPRGSAPPTQASIGENP
jgi:hypothetical protein